MKSGPHVERLLGASPGVCNTVKRVALLTLLMQRSCPFQPMLISGESTTELLHSSAERYRGKASRPQPAGMRPSPADSG